MKRNILFLCLLMAVTLMLSGCLSTLDQMYCLPKRSEQVLNLQSILDESMNGLDYCAPLSGENQQSVQVADLDGDHNPEFLVFARGSAEKPLKILIIGSVDGSYGLRTSVDSNGSAFDRVEYVQLDGKPGLELVVGCQVSEQVLRSASVYSFATGETQKLLSSNYSEFLTVDLDSDQLHELLILRPGQGAANRGIAELYGMEGDTMGRLNEVNLSEPVENLKRIVNGRLQSGEPAVYVASAAGESAMITDVFAMVDGMFRNVSLSNEAGTSVQTLRNYYVYATDIDGDGVVELPDLIDMRPVSDARGGDRQYLIRWYAMNLDGSKVDKLYTFHNYAGGWYFQLNRDWVSRISVKQSGSAFEFYIWDEGFEKADRMLTIYAYTGENREEQAVSDGRFVLYRGESVIYAGQLDENAAEYGITETNAIHGFHLIRIEWNTGETE